MMLTFYQMVKLVVSINVLKNSVQTSKNKQKQVQSRRPSMKRIVD